MRNPTPAEAYHLLSATGSENSTVSNTSSKADSSATDSQGDTVSDDKPDENNIKDSDYLIHNEAEARALCAEIEKIDNIASVEYVSSKQGLENIKETMLDGKEQYFEFLDEEYGNHYPMRQRLL